MYAKKNTIIDVELKEIQILVFTVTIIILILVITLAIFFYSFQQKKQSYLLKQYEVQRHFEEEITKSKIEIKEQTLENISWEIHDNVGQLLSIAKMQLNILQPSLSGSQQVALSESSELISKSLQELRSLAKSLNPEHFKSLGLLKAIKIELDRYNRMNFINAELEVKGELIEVPLDKGIILFRILQEFFNNTMKHSKSAKLCVKLNYSKNNLLIEIQDKGVGFNLKSVDKSKGLGLQTMKDRAKLIGASFKMESQKQKGTSITLNLPL
ncbi:MAG: histidine kinase [Flavobacteriaceae bacterium]|nr:histidine kinase [Flavobacteriaceae bacterium]